MASIEYRDFDGDLDALSSMAGESWAEEYGLSSWPDLHKPALARHHFSTVGDPRLLIGAYQGARLVAFIANLPRDYRFRGKPYRGVISCMMIGHRDYRRRGIVLELIQECLRRNEEIGRDFALITLEKKHRSSNMFEKHLKPRHRIERLKGMYPIVRPVDCDRLAVCENLPGHVRRGLRLLGAHRPMRPPSVAGTVRRYRDDDLPAILVMTRSLDDRDTLVRVFDEHTLAVQLADGDVTRTVVYERDGAVRGFANYTVLDMVGPRGRFHWAWLDFLQWDDLAAREKKALLAGVWDTAREQDCVGILEWNKNYYSKLPLLRNRFVPYPRGLELDAWMFNPDLSLAGTTRVFEQQI